MEPDPHRASTLSRRRFVQTAATAAAGVTGALAGPATGVAWDGGHDHHMAVVPPKPIPGGVTPPSGQIHVWPAGDPTVTLPFTHSTLRGLDVDPSTITDFRGFSALAYHVGTATGSDGATYNLETHMTVLRGPYVGSDGDLHFGTFSFI
jgi:hypothetical protein